MPNPFDPNPQRIERNLDYFYTINSSTSSYIHHTLHVEKQNSSGIDNTFKFELDKYLNLGTYSTGTSSAIYNFDYFSYFFERVANFDDYKISKRFGFSASYKAAMSFGDSFSLLNNIQIGSKLVF